MAKRTAKKTAKKTAKRSTRPRRVFPGNGLPDWAVHIYMKPDQALEAFAERDIQEMVAGVTGTAVRRWSISNRSVTSAAS